MLKEVCSYLTVWQMLQKAEFAVSLSCWMQKATSDKVDSFRTNAACNSNSADLSGHVRCQRQHLSREPAGRCTGNTWGPVNSATARCRTLRPVPPTCFTPVAGCMPGTTKHRRRTLSPCSVLALVVAVARIPRMTRWLYEIARTARCDTGDRTHRV